MWLFPLTAFASSNIRYPLAYIVLITEFLPLILIVCEWASVRGVRKGLTEFGMS
ncbi:MAG: hypothetical protein P4L59_11145 [Desulfosporosinus sp.]|nr:hypothetical protein [Desulfosporosinus sp.]